MAVSHSCNPFTCNGLNLHGMGGFLRRGDYVLMGIGKDCFCLVRSDLLQPLFRFGLGDYQISIGKVKLG